MTAKLILQIKAEENYKLKLEIQDKQELIKFLGEQQAQTTEFLKSLRIEINEEIQALLDNIQL